MDLSEINIFQYYGLDWACMMCGLAGAYFITYHKKYGLLLMALSSVAGLSVAIISQQYGFVLYNMLNIIFMIRALVLSPQKA